MNRFRPRPLQTFALLAIYLASGQFVGSTRYLEQAVYWLPTGVAVAGLWWLGLGYWWVVALATVLQRVSLDYPLHAALLPALGNAAEAASAVLLLRRLGFKASLGRLRDAGALFAVAAIVPGVSVLFGSVNRLFFGGPRTPFYAGWGGWWLMNALGILIVAPLALTWRTPQIQRPSPRTLLEGGLVAVVLAAVLWQVVMQMPGDSLSIFVVDLLLPIVLYAGVRFGLRWAAAAAAVSAIALVVATSHGFGPFLALSYPDRHITLQVFELSLVGVPLLLGSLIGERETALAERLKAETVRHAFEQVLPDITYRIRGDGTVLDVHIPPGLDVPAPGPDVVGRKVYEVAPAFASVGRQSIAAALAGKPPTSIEYDLMVGGLRRQREARLVKVGPDEVLCLVRDITDRKLAEATLSWQASVLELVATGRPIPEVLEAMVRGLELLSGGGLCSVHTLEGTRLYTAMAPSLPAAYNLALEGAEIGPSAGSCGAAAYLGLPIVVSDIEVDPRWTEYKALALPHGLRACWSIPIRGPSGGILGTFAIYYRERRSPTPQELALADRAASLAGIALERERREDLLASINHNLTEGVYRTTARAGLIYCNEAMARMFGYSPDELLRTPYVELWEDSGRRKELGRLLRDRGFIHNEEVRFRRRDGSLFWGLVSGKVVSGPRGRDTYCDGTVADITERKRLEEQLRQAQKMEAVGRLAGGIAHDFNNLLTAIIGYAEQLTAALPPDTRPRADAQEIDRAAQRAAGLTRQLLAFSRRQVLAPQVHELHGVVDQLGDLLRRIIGEDVQLVIRHSGDPAHVLVDRGQLEQVILNLVVNARDAMPDGGVLTITTAPVELDETLSPLQEEVRPGRYICLSVQDTGIGMDAETRRQAFDPFFTTKGQGKGTGLGLSTVYGIVRQSGGLVTIDSRPGAGTTVRIYLPSVAGRVREVESSNTAPGPSAVVGGTILVVEDEKLVRDLVYRTLHRAGYKVFVAENGEEAILVVNRERVDLVVTDVVMPRMGGRELAERLRAEHAGLRVLFVSGYIDEVFSPQGGLGSIAEYLQKPFTPTALLDRVRDLLVRTD